MANATTSTAAPKLDLNPYRRLRQAIQQLIEACEQIVNGDVNSAFAHEDDVCSAEELALAVQVMGNLWAAQWDFYLDVLDCLADTATPAPPDEAQAAPAPAPIARPAAELPPHRGRPYWLS